jgi:hypothetical protein
LRADGRAQLRRYPAASAGRGGLSVLATWLYIGSGGNLLLTSLFHAAQSFFVIVNEGIPLEQQAWLMASVYVVAALIIAIVARPRCASAIAHQGAQRDNLHVGMNGGL